MRGVGAQMGTILDVFLRGLQCVAVCCSALQRVALSRDTRGLYFVCCSVLQCVAVCCSVLQCGAVCCSVLRCVAETLVCMRVHMRAPTRRDT